MIWFLRNNALVIGLVLLAAGTWAFASLERVSLDRYAVALAQAQERSAEMKEELRLREVEFEGSRVDLDDFAQGVLEAWGALEEAGVIAVLQRVEEHARLAAVTCDAVELEKGKYEDRDVYRVSGSGPAQGIARFLAELERDPALSLISRTRVWLDDGQGLSFDFSVTMFKHFRSQANG